jgi:ATP-dependent Clp protease ATP-binding subunit ClpA
MISKELSVTLGLAVREAKKRRHEYVCVEHILFAILYDSIGIEIIENCGGNIETINRSLEEFFNDKLERVPDGTEYVLQQTIAFQRVIQRAVNHVRSAEKQEVEVSDILASIFLEKIPCGLHPAAGGHHPFGCPQLHFSRNDQAGV